MSYPIGNSCLCHCGDRVSAAYDHGCPTIGSAGNCLRNSDRALVEGRLFEHTHRPVPDDSLCIVQSVREMLYGLNSNVHAGVARVSEFDRNCFAEDALTFDRLITVDYLMIGG